MHGGGGCGHGGEKSGRRRGCRKRMSDDHDDGLLAGEKVDQSCSRDQTVSVFSQVRWFLLLGICLDSTTAILDTETVVWSWVNRKVGLLCAA